MDAAVSKELSVPEDVHQSLLKASNSSTLIEALQVLTVISRSDEGRSELSSKGMLETVLQLVKSLSPSSGDDLLLLSLRLLRNLCAGEAVNQDLFIEQNGVGVVSSVFDAVEFWCDDSGCGIVRSALQVLANVALAGEKQQRAIWDRFFPDVFVQIARVRRRETCDPLCMIIYTCSDGSTELFAELCRNPGLAIMVEIVRTASEVGFREDWLKLLLSRICVEGSHFPALFTFMSQDQGRAKSVDVHYTSAQAFLLRVVSEILNERLEEIRMGSDFALYVLGIFQTAIQTVDFDVRGQSALPTGSASIDVLGYSLTILRDICAQGKSMHQGSEEATEDDVVNTLVSKGLLDLLLSQLRELELPSSIRRTMRQDENQASSSTSTKVCPYKGFRRDMVAVIGNCSYGRKHVQDEVREKDGVILLLQHCVIDEDNPYLREWGIWCAKNLLERNVENQQLVATLEIQGTVDIPELVRLGLRAEVDPNTRRARLVNIT